MTKLADLIWKNAELLRGAFKENEKIAGSTKKSQVEQRTALRQPSLIKLCIAT